MNQSETEYIYNKFIAPVDKRSICEILMDRFPFKEGDDYYTIEDDEDGVSWIAWSCWDDESEAMYDQNPHRTLYRTWQGAHLAVSKTLRAEIASLRDGLEDICRGGDGCPVKIARETLEAVE